MSSNSKKHYFSLLKNMLQLYNYIFPTVNNSKVLELKRKRFSERSTFSLQR